MTEFTLDGRGIFLIAYVSQIILLSASILLDNRSATKTYSWIFLLALFPLLGTVLFILFGRNWRVSSKRRQRRRHELLKRTDTILKKRFALERERLDHGLYQKWERLILLGYAAPYMCPLPSSQVRLYTTGAEKFNDLKADICAAQKFIHIEYYAISSDDLTSEIFDLLQAKALQGIEVRILYDWLGSLFFRQKDKRRLKKAGVRVASGRSPLDKINYRSHRKLVVIDGETAYIGGMNLSKEYVTGGNNFSHWRDNHLRLTGGIAVSAAALFAQYWFMATKEQLLDEKHVPEASVPSARGTLIQLIHSGADTEWATIKSVFEKMISTAQREVWLETPYFIPEGSLLNALVDAALSGVEVNIIVAGESDSLLSRTASWSYFKPLLLAGARIHLYHCGFLHGKALAVDGEVCTLGSANLDSRSLNINYEANVVIYDSEFSQKVQQTMRLDRERCKEVSLQHIEAARVWHRLAWSLARLFSPVL
jgi:cardiolipin synthase